MLLPVGLNALDLGLVSRVRLLCDALEHGVAQVGLAVPLEHVARLDALDEPLARFHLGGKALVVLALVVGRLLPHEVELVAQVLGIEDGAVILVHLAQDHNALALLVSLLELAPAVVRADVGGGE